MDGFKVAEIGLIDEGRFMENANADLRQVVDRLMAHVKEHGVEATKGAKASLVAEITISFDGLDESNYSIKTNLKQKLPGRPAHVTKAVAEYQKGQPLLFVRASGSTADEDARQMRFATKDGRPIDSATGDAPALNTLTPADKRMGR